MNKIQITRTKEDGKTVKQSISVDQKQMVYYSEKYAKELSQNKVIK